MEGVPPSSMEDDVNLLDFQPNKDVFNMSKLLSPLEEVPVNQSSANNDSTQQTTQFPPHNHQVSGDHASRSPLEEVLVNQSSILCNDQGGQNILVDNNDSTQQTTIEFNHQVSGDHDLLNSNCYDSMLFEPTSSSRIQCIPNQGQVDQASVIPNIDNRQQENLMLRNFGKSTRSQIENLQVHVLQNQIARPNTSNPGPDSSLQSQNRGLNTQQFRL
ncbi:hypothetical protein OIU79_030652 [Salix purpurea]|uniref:Uncharacterized protein n=1 Tax=Salix purpurea TaxID=77065 RepID=A0A9Q0V8Z9_SALPP|nr:hypothetical protein OIU79_030652 [Salix purpurea]